MERNDIHVYHGSLVQAYGFVGMFRWTRRDNWEIVHIGAYCPWAPTA